jgi:probable F420-dependent oxidoreductase
LTGEYHALGIPFDPAGTRIDRLAEAVTLIKRLFGEGEVSFQGEHFQVEGFEGAPRPVQQPHPPIVIGGGSRRVLQLGGREADIVSLNYDNRAGLLGYSRAVPREKAWDGFQRSTGEATLKKVQWIREGAGERFDELEIHIGAYFTLITDDPPSAADNMIKTFGLPEVDVVSHPHVLIGSITGICEELVRRRETYGISYVSVGAHLIDSFAPVVQRLAGK